MGDCNCQCMCDLIERVENRVHAQSFLEGRRKAFSDLWGSVETLSCVNPNTHDDCWVSYSEILDIIDKEVNDSPSA